MAQIPATVTIPQLPQATTLTLAEVIEAVQTTGGVGNSVQIPLSSIATTLFGNLPVGGATGQLLEKTSGTNFSSQWVNLSSLLTASTGLAAAGSTAVALSLASTAGLSVLGVAGVASAVPAPIVGTGAQVLVINDAGTLANFGPVNLGSAAAVTGVLPGANYSAANLAATGAGGIQGTLPVTHGGTNTTTLTANAVLYGNGAATVGLLPAGATGQMLMGQGAAPPVMQYPGHTLLNTLVVTNQTFVQDTSSFTSTFNDYLFLVDNLVPSTSVGAVFEFQVQNAGVFQTASYVNSSAATTYVDLTGGVAVSTTAGIGVGGPLWIMNVNGSTNVKFVRGVFTGLSTASVFGGLNSFGYWNGATTAITGWKIQMGTGTFSGVIRVYGLRAS